MKMSKMKPIVRKQLRKLKKRKKREKTNRLMDKMFPKMSQADKERKRINTQHIDNRSKMNLEQKKYDKKLKKDKGFDKK